MSETMSTSGIKDEGDDESEIVQTTPEQEFSSKNELDQLDRQRTDSRDADVSERFTTSMRYLFLLILVHVIILKKKFVINK